MILLMFKQYVVRDHLQEIVVALGSDQPVRIFAKFKFDKKGDIFWFKDLLKYEGRVDEHVSFHASGHIARTSINTNDGYNRHWVKQPSLAAIVKSQQGMERFSEDYFYEGLAALKSPSEKRVIIELLDRAIIGSTIRYSIHLINETSKQQVQSALAQVAVRDNPRQHTLVITHQKRSLLLHLGFEMGDGPVNDGKLRDANARKLTAVKISLGN